MYVFACMYERDTKFWYDKLMSDIKKLDTLYVVMLPPLEEVVKRIKKRGDDIQDENSIVKVWNAFNVITKLSVIVSFRQLASLKESRVNVPPTHTGISK